jgi:ATP-binding cassette, subfamily C, type I secretion system permease/ATPase
MVWLILRHQSRQVGIKLKLLTGDERAGRLRFAVNSALTFCGHIFSQLGFADVESNEASIARSSLRSNVSESNATSSTIQPTIRAALQSCRSVFLSLGLISGVINILMLTGSFFMLQVYDRVLPSQSVPTLVGLALLATVLFVLQGALEVIRSRVNVRIGAHLDHTLSSRVYDALVRLPLKTRGDGDGLQPLRDLDYVRSFLSGGGPAAFFDLPWLPVYLGICFLFHFWIGVTALAGSLVLIALALLTEYRMRAPAKEAARFATTRTAFAAAGRRNAEVLKAMGMSRHVGDRWSAANRDYLAANERASDIASGLGGLSKVFRTILQSAVLAVGAFLVIRQESTAGIIIASSILTSRALAPVELAIANWKGFVAARQGAQRLYQLLELLPAEQEPMRLPKPKSALSVTNVAVLPPGSERLAVTDISFELKSGQGLAIIGPSGSGKSSLARALVGVWQPARGNVRLDRATLDQWSSGVLGQHIGYLPQDVELFDGTVASNIGRFDVKAKPEEILEAAQAAGVHDLILSLPGGYATPIGELGTAISGGQRQRIALARALYGNPFLVVLDEPSSNLDSDGEGALTQAIMNVRARGGIVIVVAHRPSALAGVDQVLVMRDGKQQIMGAKDEVMNKLMRPSAPIATPVRVTM